MDQYFVVGLDSNGKPEICRVDRDEVDSIMGRLEQAKSFDPYNESSAYKYLSTLEGGAAEVNTELKRPTSLRRLR